MTNTLANYIRFDGNRVTGNVATLTFDFDVTGEPVESENEQAPVFRLYGQSPRGKRISVGGIWERDSRTKPGSTYFTLTLNTGHGSFYANLGRYPGQDDPDLYAVIPNDYLNERTR